MAGTTRRPIKAAASEVTNDESKVDTESSVATGNQLADAAANANNSVDLPPVTSNIITDKVEDAAAVVESTSGENIRIALERKQVEDLDDVVTVISPNAFTLTLDNGGLIHIPQGISEQVRAHVTHWYARAQGVKIYQPAG